MKYRITAVGAGALGLGALVLRILEYFNTIDGDGFYLLTSLASTLKVMLTVVLVVGVLYCVALPFGGRKEEAELPLRYGIDWLPRILFGLMGLCTGAHGIVRLLSAAATMDKVVAALLIIGALGWLWMGRSPKRAGLMALLPAAALGGEIVRYFWSTYKYIHVSAYVLGMLGWCAAFIFVFSLCKGLNGAACSKHRLAMCGGWVLLILPAAFMAPLVDKISVESLLRGAEGLLLVILAAYWMDCLERELPQQAEWPEANLSQLNEMLENIPDPEDE